MSEWLVFISLNYIRIKSVGIHHCPFAVQGRRKPIVVNEQNSAYAIVIIHPKSVHEGGGTQPSAHSGDVYSIPVTHISDIALDNYSEFPTF